MTRRELDLKTLDEVVAEVRRLNEGGYTKGGEWDLSQVCLHLSSSINQTIDGFMFKVPLTIRIVARLFVKRSVLQTRKIRPGNPIPPEQVPGPSDEYSAVAILATTVDRYKAHRGGLHKHPVFGRLTHGEWREIHIIHGSHHLSFLLPRGKS